MAATTAKYVKLSTTTKPWLCALIKSLSHILSMVYSCVRAMVVQAIQSPFKISRHCVVHCACVSIHYFRAE